MSTKALKLVALGVAIAGLVVYLLSRPDEGFIVGLTALSDDEALLLVRANYDDDPSEAWMMRVRAGGEVVWTTELPKLPDSTGARHGMATDGRVAVVQLQGEGPDERAGTVAVNVSDGTVAWELDGPHGVMSLLGAPPRIAGELLIDPVAPAPGRTRYEARDLASGELVYAHESQGHPMWYRLSDRWLAHVEGFWTVVRRERDGPRVREGRRVVDPHGDVCLDGDALVGLHRGKLARADLTADPVKMTTADLRLPGPPPFWAKTCGRRSSDFVFLGFVPQMEDHPARSVLIRVRDGRALWSVPFAGLELENIGGGPDRQEPAWHPLRSQLTRFAAFVMDRHAGDESRHQLVVVDLDEGRLAWKSPVLHELLHYQVVRGPSGVLYLTHGGRIVAIDGATGRMLAAVRVPNSGIRGLYASEHRIWVPSMAWSSHDSLPFTVLDARTLERVGSANQELQPVEDAFAETAEWLKVPEAYRGPSKETQ